MKKKIALILSLVLTLSLVACGSKSTNESAKTENTAQTTDEKKFEGVTLKAFTSYGKIENAFADFTEKTGIKVEYTPLSTGAALAKLNAEEGKSDVDVWLGGGADSYIAAKDKDYLYQYVSEGSKDIDDMYKDKDGSWTAVSFQTAGIIVNTQVLEKLNLPVPKTWEDLTNPIYKGEIIFANPAISGTAYAMLETMYQNWGEEKTYDYLTKMNENVAYYTEGGGEPSKKVAAGEFAIGFVPVTGEYYELQKENPVSIIIPEDMLPWISSPVAIFKNSKNIEAAKVFVDYFTSKEGGDALQKAEVRVMSRNDIEMPEVMKDVTKDSFLPVDMSKMAENRDKVLARFTEIAGTKAPVKK
ncbi:MAG: ABC transporter substrate-binding protein [Clostridium sp.]